VIGLAGGIGSGKSHVAKLLAARGAIVSDSDDQAKALLREPGIADILARWWGKGILGPPPGKLPDRAKIAAIVFADHAQRTRLEGLIHPILKSQRTAALRAAARQVPRPPLFVIDAPLLFEAGLDKECDGVLFVDAPREERILRVSRNRGWTEEDLARREAAQLPVDVKKSRSTFTIDNGTGAGGTGADDPDARLNRQLDELWPRLITRRAPRQSRA
jgi:dephospho-CoA kinase